MKKKNPKWYEVRTSRGRLVDKGLMLEEEARAVFAMHKGKDKGYVLWEIQFYPNGRLLGATPIIGGLTR